MTSPGNAVAAQISAQVLARGLDVDFTLAAGETVALLGPNGAGKSTLLAIIAGLFTPDSGFCRVGQRVLFDLGSPRRRWMPAHARNVSMLTQDPLLFPHLSVVDNVAFGPRAAGAGRAASRIAATDWLRRVDAEELKDRSGHQLSGGQAQRIAVARALAAEPDLLLLDEPLAATDASIRPGLRRMLRDVLADRTAVVVTHDLLDALTLADRVIVLDDGRIVDDGSPSTVLDHPVTAFAAELAGLNLLAGTVVGPGLVRVEDDELGAMMPSALPRGATAALTVRPSDVRLHLERPTASGALPGSFDALDNSVLDRIVDLDLRGDVVRVHGKKLSADIAPAEIARLDLVPGIPVWFSFTSEDAVAYAHRLRPGSETRGTRT